MNKYVRKVTRVGKRSLAIVIPADLAKEFNLRERQKLIIRRSGRKITLEDWKR